MAQRVINGGLYRQCMGQVVVNGGLYRQCRGEWMLLMVVYIGSVGASGSSPALHRLCRWGYVVDCGVGVAGDLPVAPTATR